MSHYPTKSEIKERVDADLAPDKDFDVLLQDLVDKTYYEGLVPMSREDLVIDLSTDRTSWDDYPCVLVDPAVYDGSVGFRDNHKPKPVRSWKIIDVEATHESPVAWSSFFIDHGEKVVLGNIVRVYQLPTCLETSVEVIRGRMKVRAPRLVDDLDEVPIHSAQAIKIGLMSMSYESDGDWDRAAEAWTSFTRTLSSGNFRVEGVKTRFIGFDSFKVRKSKNFM